MSRSHLPSHYWFALILALVLLAVPFGKGFIQAENIISSPPPTDPIPTTRQMYYESLINKIAATPTGRDGIPTLDSPSYVSVGTANTWLQNEDIVFGLNYSGFKAAYPQKILVHHEIVNDVIAGNNVTITYSPLTGSALAFLGQVSAGSVSMKQSGEVANSNLIMYDQTTKSYWPQLMGEAINGSEEGNFLTEIPLIWTTWGNWKAEYPTTQVLSNNTGHALDYTVAGDPYGSYLESGSGYYTSDTILYPVLNEDNRLPPKTVVVGIHDHYGNTIAIRKSYLRSVGTVLTTLGLIPIRVVYNSDLDSYTASTVLTGQPINGFDVMWFAWAGYNSNTMLIN